MMYDGDIMERLQVQFTPEQLRDLKRLAEADGLSTAAVVREAVDAYVKRSPTDRRRAKMLSAIGCFESGPNVSEEHDRYLGEAFA